MVTAGAGVRTDAAVLAAGPPGWPLSGGPACPGRVFAGTADQVRAVRRFVGEHLTGHPAHDDAVVIASELASNSVSHSFSRGAEGRFLVHVLVLGPGHGAVIVTDAGGPPIPAAGAGPDAESGRGLTVVRSLACWFAIQDHDGLRTFAAVIHGTGRQPETTEQENSLLAGLNCGSSSAENIEL